MKMQINLFRLLVCILVAFSSLAIAEEPPAATKLLDAAKKQAKAEKKNIFIMFDASW